MARKEAKRCRVAVAEPCTFRLFLAIGWTVGWTVGRTFLSRISPLTILLRTEKAALWREYTPLITIKRRDWEMAQALYLSGFWRV